MTFVDLPIPDFPPDQSTLRRELEARVPAPAPGQRATAETYIDGTYTYPKTLEDNTPCAQRLFVIAADRIRNFRKQLKPHFPMESPPTICNVLAALTWIHVTRARAVRMGDCEQKETNIAVAVDLRKRLSPQLESSYMGNMALFSKGTLKVAKLRAEDR